MLYLRKGNEEVLAYLLSLFERQVQLKIGSLNERRDVSQDQLLGSGENSEKIGAIAECLSPYILGLKFSTIENNFAAFGK